MTVEDAMNWLGRRLFRRAVGTVVGALAIGGAGAAAHYLFGRTDVTLVALAPARITVGDAAYFSLAAAGTRDVELSPGHYAVGFGDGKSVDVEARRGGGRVLVPSPRACAVHLAAGGSHGVLEVTTPGAPVVVADDAAVGVREALAERAGTAWVVVGCDRVSAPPAAIWASARERE